MRAPSKRLMTRISGTGNSFIICNTFPVISDQLDFEKRSKLAKDLCLETPGLTADGFICLDPSQKSNFKWDFYNSNGSRAEMCGNAARCVAIYYYLKIQQEKKIIFESSAGLIAAEILNVDDQIVRVSMPQVSQIESKKIVSIDGKNIRGYFINSGVPHFVLQNEPDRDLARKVRKAKGFGAAGTNVTFVDFDDTDYIHAVTFERGVEDFTLACGTGAVAAAQFHFAQYPEQKELFIEMPGGVLSVDLRNEQPYLTGDVEVQFDFSIYEDLI